MMTAAAFDADNLSVSKFVDLPAQVSVNGQLYGVAKWSLSNFVVETDGYLPEGDQDIEFVLPYGSHNCSFRARCKVVRCDKVCNFRFLQLPHRARNLMREYVEESIEVSEPRDDASYDLVPAMQPVQVRRLKGQFLRRVVFYGLVVVVVFAMGWWCWRELSYVYSLRGSVAGDLIQFKAPEVGTIKSLLIMNGQEISRGDLLYQLEDKAYVRKRDRLIAVRDRLEDEVQAVKIQIEDEEKRITLNAGVAEKRMHVARADLDSAVSQMELARANLKRGQQLYQTRAIASQEVDTLHQALSVAEANVNRAKRLLELQDYVLTESKDGRFFTGTSLGGTHQGRAAQLGKELAQKRTQIERINHLISDVESDIEKCKVYAPVNGKVDHLNRQEGDSVTAGEHVLTLEAEGARSYIVAHFTAQDVQYLRYGGPCELVFPSHGLSVKGRIAAIGHSGLNASGVLSQDEQPALGELPVKIEFLKPVEVRRGEGVFVKIERDWKVTTYLKKLY